MIRNNGGQKFGQLVTTAHDLFMRFGIRRVTVAEICFEANVSKMTFYKYFKNKNEILKYLLKRICSEQMTEYRKIMAQQVAFPEKVKQIIQLKHEQTKMMSQEFFHDLWKNPNPEIVKLLEKLRQQSLNEILTGFKIARENGDIRQNIKPEFILYFLNHMTEMVNDEQLLKLYQSPNELAMELTSFFFYGILTPKNSEN
ncbi:MAG TPA: TetR/AcrR family transcriptional regulator [bacterium]|nr:TetR/AcrR family transcriptional regulator [bacterium]